MKFGIKQKASLFAISFASVLAVSKFVVGLRSGSMAVVSSGLDSILDVLMSGMNFLAIRKADDPPDKEHHYGHGKIEDLAAVVQSLVIMFTGCTIIYKAFEKYYTKDMIAYTGWDMSVMLLSLLFSFIISRTLFKIGQATGSNALKADALHYSSDLYSNSGAILAIVITYLTKIALFDLLFAVIIGLVIFYSAGQILRNGVAGLMDTSLPRELKKQIEDVLDARSLPFAGYHKLRSRLSGSRKYLDFHLLICRKATVDEAHDIANQIEADIRAVIENIDVISHIEPCPYTCELTASTCRVVKMKANSRASDGGIS